MENLTLEEVLGVLALVVAVVVILFTWNKSEQPGGQPPNSATRVIWTLIIIAACLALGLLYDW